MKLIDQIKKYSESLQGEIEEKKGLYELKLIIAERKAFLSKQKLEYRAKFRIDDSEKVLRFSETLKESGSGLSAGGEMGESPGFGFQAIVTKSGLGGEETIFEQSNRYAKKYKYESDPKAIRSKFEEIAKSAGYDFKYQMTAKGL